eukprot:15485193-Alexandrium_andersonii.AAC.1
MERTSYVLSLTRLSCRFPATQRNSVEPGRLNGLGATPLRTTRDMSTSVGPGGTRQAIFARRANQCD